MPDTGFSFLGDQDFKDMGFRQLSAFMVEGWESIASESLICRDDQNDLMDSTKCFLTLYFNHNSVEVGLAGSRTVPLSVCVADFDSTCLLVRAGLSHSY